MDNTTMASIANVSSHILSIVCCIYGSLLLFVPQDCWYHLMAVPEGVRMADLDGLWDMHSKIVHQSNGIFTVVLAVFGHVAAGCEKCEQAIMIKSFLLGIASQGFLNLWNVFQPGMVALETAYWRLALLMGALTLFLSTGLLMIATNGQTSDNSSLNKSSYGALRLSQITHFGIGFPFGLISLVWPRALYLVLQPLGVSDTSTPFELLGIQYWGTMILCHTTLAWNAHALSLKTQRRLAIIMMVSFFVTTILYWIQLPHLNTLYTYCGPPIFAFMGLSYAYGLAFQATDPKKD